MFRKRILEYSKFNCVVDLEYFCRGAAATDSNKLDWKYDSRADLLTIFIADEHVYNTIRLLFGQPSKDIIL